MSIEIKTDAGKLCITLEETCHTGHLEAAHSTLMEQIDQVTHVMLDTLACETLDSAVTQWLLAIKKHCVEHHIPFRVASLSESVSDMFALYRLFDALKEHRVLNPAIRGTS